MEEYNHNMKLILSRQLAFESYQDDTGNNIDLLDKAYEDLAQFRKEKDKFSDSEKLRLSKEILEKLDNVLDIIGKDNFIFYDDNTINYIWKNH